MIDRNSRIVFGAFNIQKLCIDVRKFPEMALCVLFRVKVSFIIINLLAFAVSKKTKKWQLLSNSQFGFFFCKKMQNN